MIVNCLKGKEIEENPHIKIDKFQEYIIGNDLEINLFDIPKICVDGNNDLYFAQIGMNIYIIYKQYDEKISWFYIIEQGIDKNKMKIENLYTTTYIDKYNLLERFFKYDKEFEKDNVKRLFSLIDAIQVIPEKDYLKSKITEYFEKDEKAKAEYIAHLEAGFKEPIKHLEIVDTSAKYAYKGKEYDCLSELAKDLGISYKSLWSRIHRGTPLEKAIEKTIAKKGIKAKLPKLYEYMGEKLTLEELSELSGISATAIYQRIKAGKSVQEAVETPAQRV